MYDLDGFEEYKKPRASKSICESIVVCAKQIRMTKAAAEFIGKAKKVDVLIDYDNNFVALQFGDQGEYAISKRHGISSVFGGQRLARHLLEIVGNRPYIKVVDDRTLLLMPEAQSYEMLKKKLKTVILSLLFISCVCVGMWVHWLVGISVLLIAFAVEMKCEKE